MTAILFFNYMENIGFRSVWRSHKNERCQKEFSIVAEIMEDFFLYLDSVWIKVLRALIIIKKIGKENIK